MEKVNFEDVKLEIDCTCPKCKRVFCSDIKDQRSNLICLRITYRRSKRG